MKLVDLAAPVLVGGLLGAVWPVRSAEGSEVAATAPRPEPADETAPAAPDPRCVPAAQVDAARRAARSWVANASSVEQAFIEDWGRPPDPPPGFVPEQAAGAIYHQLRDVPARFVDVSCNAYPCTAAVAPEDGVSRQDVAEALGVEAPRFGGGSVYVNERNHLLVVLPVTDLSGLNDDEVRFVKAMVDRHHLEAADQWAKALEASGD